MLLKYAKFIITFNQYASMKRIVLVDGNQTNLTLLLHITRAIQDWSIYIKINAGMVHLAAIIDWHSKAVSPIKSQIQWIHHW
mgnify:FL=1